MKKNRQKITLTIVLIILPIFAQIALAQSGPAGPPPTPSGVPIDGGISLLLAGLGAYAYKKFYNSKEE